MDQFHSQQPDRPSNAESEQLHGEPPQLNEESPQQNEDAVRQSPAMEDAEPSARKEGAPEAPSKKSRFWKEVREWIVSLAVAVLIALLIRTFLFTIIRVDGESMVDTLHNNERLFVTVFDMKFGDPERGDVVICHYPNRGRTNFVKRVRGVPGDVVMRKNGVTYINGEPIDELKNNSRMYPSGSPTDYAAYTLGEDEYFVVGDNI